MRDAAVRWFIRRSVHRCRVLASGLLVLALVWSGTGTAEAAEENAVGQVVRQQGAVLALRDGLARPLLPGALVYRGDRITTRFDGKVEVEFRDGSVLTIGSGSDVDLDQYAPDSAQPGRLTLLIGIIRMNLSNLWSGGFEVRTRAAVASVRSTHWVTEAKEDRSSVFVIAGEVEVVGVAERSRVLLSEGLGTDVEAGGAPSAPKRWGSSRVEDVLARTRLP